MSYQRQKRHTTPSQALKGVQDITEHSSGLFLETFDIFSDYRVDMLTFECSGLRFLPLVAVDSGDKHAYKRRPAFPPQRSR